MWIYASLQNKLLNCQGALSNFVKKDYSIVFIGWLNGWHQSTTLVTTEISQLLNGLPQKEEEEILVILVAFWIFM